MFVRFVDVLRGVHMQRNLKSGALNMLAIGLESYIRAQLPLITQQPPRRQDIAPSVLEHNLSAYVDEKEREDEWNKAGVESGTLYENYTIHIATMCR